jgi:hypothetical protein
VDVFQGFETLEDLTTSTKTNQPKNERSDVYSPIHLNKLRHLVEEREEKWRFFREERKAV